MAAHVSNMNVSQVISVIREIEGNHSLTKHEQEHQIRSVLADYLRHSSSQSDIGTFLRDVMYELHAKRLNARDAAQICDIFDAHSALFLDLVHSQAFTEILQLLPLSLTSSPDGVRIISKLIGMAKISWKANLSHYHDQASLSADRTIDRSLSTLLSFSLQLIVNPDQALAEQATRIIEELAPYLVVLGGPTEEAAQQSVQAFVDQLFNETDRQFTANSEINVFRYLTIVTNLLKEDSPATNLPAGQSTPEFIREKQSILGEKLTSHHRFLHFIEEFCFSARYKQDVLTQMTALDTLPSFGNSSQGFEAIKHSRLMNWLITLLDHRLREEEEGSTANSDFSSSDIGVLESEALRTLSVLFSLASKYHTSLTSGIATTANLYHAFLRGIFHHIALTEANTSHEEPLRISALATLSDFIVISAESLRNLEDFHLSTVSRVPDYPTFLSLLIDGYLNSAKVEFSSSVLVLLAKIYEKDDVDYLVETDRQLVASQGATPWTITDVTNFKKRLFHRIGEAKRTSTVHYLVKAARSPIPSFKQAAKRLIRSLVMQSTGWALSLLFGVPEFWAYLSDRYTEHSHEEKVLKFEVISAIRESTGFGILSDELKDAIQLMVRQGAFYMPPRMEEMETI